jgi:hypothetical protein
LRRGSPSDEQRNRRITQRVNGSDIVRWQSERRHRAQSLAPDRKRLSTRCEHPNAGAAGQNRLGDLCCRADQVLAVVQHDQALLIAQALDETCPGIGRRDMSGGLRGIHPPSLAQPQRIDDRLCDVFGIGDRSQFDQPHAVRKPFGEPMTDLDGEPGLTGATRPHESHQPRFVEALSDQGEFGVPADEGGEWGRQIVPDRDPADADLGSQARVAPQDREVQFLQVGHGIGSQLVGQAFASVLIDLQRIGLPSGRVQGPHLQRTKSLAHRIRVAEQLQVGEHGRVLAECEFGGDPVLDRVEAQRVQPCHRGPGVRRVGHVGQCLAAPQRQRVTQRCRSRARVARAEFLVAAFGQGLESVRVNSVPVQLQAVATGDGLDHLGVVEHPTQPRYQRLQGIGRGRFVCPQQVE